LQFPAVQIVGHCRPQAGVIFVALRAAQKQPLAV
jgi:hypothetical protein